MCSPLLKFSALCPFGACSAHTHPLWITHLEFERWIETAGHSDGKESLFPSPPANSRRLLCGFYMFLFKLKLSVFQQPEMLASSEAEGRDPPCGILFPLVLLSPPSGKINCSFITGNSTKFQLRQLNISR